MNRQTRIAGGAAIGAALMYFLDPDRGRRRRARVRDKAASVYAHSGDAIGKVARDLKNRAMGTAASARSLARFRKPPIDDPVLTARVRTKIGRLVSHPASIEVTATGGRVTLSGPVLEREVDGLLRGVRSVDGVEEIDNRLEVHRQARDVPGLQGGTQRPGNVPELLQTNWTPAVRLMVGAAGGTMAAYAVAARSPISAIPGVLGLGMLTRAITNTEVKRLIGAGGGRRAVDIRKTITINAPFEQVFEFWANYRNFPRFMRHITEVRELGFGRSHWKAEAPVGGSVSWDAEITRFEPNRVLAWRSTPGSTIENAGIIHFDPAPNGGTRVDMQLSYSPPAGALGHAVAWLFRRDLKTELDEDLVRLKSLLEEGKTRSASGERVTREGLEGAPIPTPVS